MLAAALFARPDIDYHAFAPEIVLVATLLVVLVVDLVFEERARWATSTITGLGLLGALVPILTLAVNGHDRVMFGGAYAVDNFALVMKGMLLALPEAAATMMPAFCALVETKASEESSLP